MKLDELPSFNERMRQEKRFVERPNCDDLESHRCRSAFTWTIIDKQKSKQWRSPPSFKNKKNGFDGMWDIHAPGNPFVEEIVINIDTAGGLLSRHDPNSSSPVKANGVWRHKEQSQHKTFTPYITATDDGSLTASMGQFSYCSCVPIRMSVRATDNPDLMIGEWSYKDEKGKVTWRRRDPVTLKSVSIASARKNRHGEMVSDDFSYGERSGRIERKHPVTCGYGQMQGNCDSLWVTVKGDRFAGAHTLWIDTETHIELQKAGWLCKNEQYTSGQWTKCGHLKEIGDGVAGIQVKLLFRYGMTPGLKTLWVDGEPIHFEVYLTGHPDNDSNVSCPWDSWEDVYDDFPHPYIEIGGGGQFKYRPKKPPPSKVPEVVSKLTDEELDKILRETLQKTRASGNLKTPANTRLAYQAPKNVLKPTSLKAGSFLGRGALFRFLGASLAFDAAIAHAMWPYMGNQWGLGIRYRKACMDQWEMWQALDYDVAEPPSPAEVAMRATTNAIMNNMILEDTELRKHHKYPNSFDDRGRLRARNGCSVESKPLVNFKPGKHDPWLWYQVGITGQPSEYTVTTPSEKSKEFDGLRFAFNQVGEATIFYGIEVKGNIDPGREEYLKRWITQAWDQREIANECGFALNWVVGRETVCNRVEREADYRRLIPAHDMMYWPHDDLPPPIFELLVSQARICF